MSPRCALFRGTTTVHTWCSDREVSQTCLHLVHDLVGSEDCVSFLGELSGVFRGPCCLSTRRQAHHHHHLEREREKRDGTSKIGERRRRRRNLDSSNKEHFSIKYCISIQYIILV